MSQIMEKMIIPFLGEKSKNIIFENNANDISKKGEWMYISNNEKIINHAIKMHNLILFILIYLKNTYKIYIYFLSKNVPHYKI